MPNKLTCSICPAKFITKENLFRHEKCHCSPTTFSCDLCSDPSKEYTSWDRLKRHWYQSHPKKLLSCNRCGKNYKRHKNLRQHLVTCITSSSFSKPANEITTLRTFYPDVNDLSCLTCQKTFCTRFNLRRHLKQVHSKDRIKQEQKLPLSNYHTCAVCQKTFVSKSTFSSHCKISHRRIIAKFTCTICSMNFTKLKTAQKHESCHLTPTTFSCHLCPEESEEFVSWVALTRHWNKSHPKFLGKFPCTECAKVLKSYSSLKNHMRIHHSVTRHICNKCPLKFRSKNVLFSHNRMVHGNKIPRCSVCQKIFTYEATLLHHLKRNLCQKPDHKGRLKEDREPREEKFTCDLCPGKLFTQWKLLRRHEVNVHPRNMVPCSLCTKQFKNKTKLRDHIRNLHTTDGLFECDICHARFKHLNSHKSTHTGEKPYQCDECGKCFRFQQYLTSHVTMHTDARPFSCRHCPKKFKTPKYRCMHEKASHGKIKFTCGKCGCMRSSLANMRVHEKNCKAVAKNILFACSKCSAMFRTTSEYKKHERSHDKATSAKVNQFVNHSLDSKPLEKIAGPFYPVLPFTAEKQSEATIDNGQDPTLIATFSFSCGRCKKRFKTKEEVIKHANLYHSQELTREISRDISRDPVCITEEPKTCHLCSKIFNNKKSLESHMVCHSEPANSEDAGDNDIAKNYVLACRICMKRFDSETEAISHSKSHEPKGKEICNSNDLCDEADSCSNEVSETEKIEGTMENTCLQDEGNLGSRNEDKMNSEKDDLNQDESNELSDEISDTEALNQSRADVKLCEKRRFVSPVKPNDKGAFTDMKLEPEDVKLKTEVPDFAYDDISIFDFGQDQLKVERDEKLTNCSNVSGSSGTEQDPLSPPTSGDMSPDSGVDLQTANGHEVENVHDATAEQCFICSKSFLMRVHLKDHLRRTHHVYVNQSKTGIAEKTSRYHHISRRRQLQMRPLGCPSCPVKFKDKDQVAIHLKMHSIKRRIFGQNSTKKAGVTQHQPRKKPDSNQYKCNVCTTTCKNLISLRRHMPKHASDYAFQCSVCPNMYESEHCLQRHFRKSHESQSDLFQCHLCSALFFKQEDILNHKLQHKKEKRFKCDQCPFATKTGYHLKCHKRVVHTNTKPFVCEVCGKSFKDKSTLKDHAGVHTTDRNFPCDQCESRCDKSGRKFASSVTDVLERGLTAL